MKRMVILTPMAFPWKVTMESYRIFLRHFVIVILKLKKLLKMNKKLVKTILEIVKYVITALLAYLEGSSHLLSSLL